MAEFECLFELKTIIKKEIPIDLPRVETKVLKLVGALGRK